MSKLESNKESYKEEMLSSTLTHCITNNIKRGCHKRPSNTMLGLKDLIYILIFILIPISNCIPYITLIFSQYLSIEIH